MPPQQAAWPGARPVGQQRRRPCNVAPSTHILTRPLCAKLAEVCSIAVQLLYPATRGGGWLLRLLSSGGARPSREGPGTACAAPRSHRGRLRGSELKSSQPGYAKAHLLLSESATRMFPAASSARPRGRANCGSRQDSSATSAAAGEHQPAGNQPLSPSHLQPCNRRLVPLLRRAVVATGRQAGRQAGSTPQAAHRRHQAEACIEEHRSLELYTCHQAPRTCKLPFPPLPTEEVHCRHGKAVLGWAAEQCAQVRHPQQRPRA